MLLPFECHVFGSVDEEYYHCTDYLFVNFAVLLARNWNQLMCSLSVNNHVNFCVWKDLDTTTVKLYVCSVWNFFSFLFSELTVFVICMRHDCITKFTPHYYRKYT